MNPVERRATVIGAGIVGVCCAAWLQRKGWQVTLIDRNEPGEGCSFGNTGVLAPSAFLPVAMPGMLKQIPAWLLDPLGPLSIRWQYLPRLAPWLVRFLRCANGAAMNRSAAAMRTLVEPALECYAPLIDNAKAHDLIRDGGSLFVWDSRESFDVDEKMRALRRKFGTRLDELGEGDIRSLEPDLSPHFKWGVLAPTNWYTVNPQRLTSTIARQLVADGGTFIRGEVRELIPADDGFSILKTDRGDIAAPVAVVAAGAWSKALAARAGDNVPLESQRGYHVTFADPGVRLQRPVSWVSRRIFTTPMEMGLRIAGTVELAGLSAAPDWRRAEVLAGIAQEMYPALNVTQKHFWMGHRPCLPDSLPVVGAATRARNVYYAFGHQHVGMCSAPATGKSIAELISGEQPNIDLAPFRPDRFKR